MKITVLTEEQLAAAKETTRFMMQACGILQRDPRWEERAQEVAEQMLVVAGMNEQSLSYQPTLNDIVESAKIALIVGYRQKLEEVSYEITPAAA